MMEFLLYGLEQNESRDYMETLLFVTENESLIEKAKAYASGKGFHSFRVATYKGEKPDFIKAINKAN